MRRIHLGKRTMACLTALFVLLGALPFSVLHVHAEEPCEHFVDWVFDEVTHWGTCELCHSWQEEEHVYGEDGTCVCGYFEHEHTTDGWEGFDENRHWSWCAMCNLFMEEPHAYGDDGTCVCGCFEHDHVVLEWRYDAEEYHWGGCYHCGVYLEEEHAFDTDGKCACGYFVHEHENGSGEWHNDHDEIEHEGLCSICGIVFYAAHEYGTDDKCICGYYVHDHGASSLEIESTDTHTELCECGYRYYSTAHYFEADGKCECGYEEHEHAVSRWGYTLEDHYGICNICGFRFAEAHTFDADGKCECGYFEHEHTCEDWWFDRRNHGGECEICFLEVSLGHEVVDGKCVCGYEEHEHTVSKWKVWNDVYHFGYCDICDTYQEQSHRFDENKRCLCGYEEHVHKEGLYDFNLEGHWGICSVCEQVIGNGEKHSYDKDHRCVCGRVELIGVRIGDHCLVNGDYLDLNGKITKTEPTEGGYAHYKDGVLTLKDFELAYDKDPEGAVYGSSGIYCEKDLEILLVGKNHILSLNGDGIRIPNGSLIIRGEGSLLVEAFGDYDGMEAEEDLTVKSGSLTIIATDHGLECDGNVYLEGGSIYIDAGDDGIDCVQGVEIKEGVMLVIHSEDNGIDSNDDDVIIHGGVVYIYSREENGIEAYSEVIINGGTVIIDADGGNGILAEFSVQLNGGRLTINTKALRRYAVVTYGEVLPRLEIGGYCYLPSIDDYYALGLNSELLSSVSLEMGESTTTLIERDWISLKTDIIYTGEAHTPTLSVTDPNTGKLLKEGTDYRVTMPTTPFTKLGVYPITVIGMGNYSGVIGKTVWVYESFELVPGQSGKKTFFHNAALKNGYFSPKVDGTYTVTVTCDDIVSFCVYDADGNCIAEVYRLNDEKTISWTYEMKAGEEYFFNFFADGFFEAEVGLSAVCDAHVGGTATEKTLAVCDRCGAEYGELLTPTPEISENEVPPAPEQDPPADRGLSAGAITGIAIGASSVGLLGGFSLFWFVIKKKSFADLIAIFKH